LVLKISKKISKKQKRRTWLKLFTASDETVDIGGLKERLDAFIIEFQVCEALLHSLLEAYDQC